MGVYPQLLELLIEHFKQLSGVGEKTAERYALSLIDLDETELKDFSESISLIKQTFQKCTICGHLSESDICSICKDETRNDNLICVVENYKSVFMFEKTAKFKGKYHVLGGLISPIDGINPEDLNIAPLVSRCKDKKMELIIALKPTIEGDTTTLYLKKILEKYNLKITRLSYGIPVGADIDYLDVLTLERAILDRKEVE